MYVHTHIYKTYESHITYKTQHWSNLPYAPPFH